MFHPHPSPKLSGIKLFVSTAENRIKVILTFFFYTETLEWQNLEMHIIAKEKSQQIFGHLKGISTSIKKITNYDSTLTWKDLPHCQRRGENLHFIAVNP